MLIPEKKVKVVEGKVTKSVIRPSDIEAVGTYRDKDGEIKL